MCKDGPREFRWLFACCYPLHAPLFTAMAVEIDETGVARLESTCLVCHRADLTWQEHYRMRCGWLARPGRAGHSAGAAAGSRRGHGHGVAAECRGPIRSVTSVQRH